MNTTKKIAFFLHAYCLASILIHATHAMDNQPEDPNRNREFINAIFERYRAPEGEGKTPTPEQERLINALFEPLFPLTVPYESKKKPSPQSKSPVLSQRSGSPEKPRKPWNPGDEPPVFEEPSGAPRSKKRIIIVPKPKSPKND